MKEFITKSFKRELLAGFLAVALLPLIISSLFLIQLFRIKLDSDYQKQAMEQVGQIDEKLTGLLDDFQVVTENLTRDEQIRTALSGAGGSTRSEIYSCLYRETLGLRKRAEAELYTTDGICQYSTGTELYHTRLLPYWGILKVAAAHPDELIIRREQEYAGDRRILLRAARAITDEADNQIGFAVISMTAANFEELLRGDYGSRDGICILNEFWETVYAAGAAEREDIGTVLRGQLLKGDTYSDSYHGNRLYVSRLGETGLTTVLLRPEFFTADTIKSMYSVLLVMALASLLLCIVVSAKISNHLSWPISRLNQAMHQLQQGNLDVRIALHRRDEFGQLSENFNTTAQELKGYMEQQVSQQKKLNDVQIAMMQAQLNPHFLYNTLDTIKWSAKANHIPELATLAAKLAKILRTSISREAFIPLRDEVELVNSYVEIQRIRFNGRFTFVCDLPEAYADAMVPKLILQPVVENAVIHGLAECEEGSIRVRVSGTGERIRIEVQDDGCGMDQEKLDLINHRNWESISGHIGMYNVDTIIRLHYGDAYGIHAESPKEGGTLVVIELPEGKEVTQGS